jgi:pyrroloquinoline-quinone synthase
MGSTVNTIMEVHMSTIVRTIDEALDGHRLLEHPFYRRWTLGTLTLEELREYAAQYRSIETAQPRWLAGIADQLESGPARESVGYVLRDELDPDATHAELFDTFAAAIGAPDSAPPTAATARLIATLDGLVADGPVSGLGGLLAYELQSAAVSREKATGLRDHFGVDGDGAAFWETHAVLDQRHAGWLLDAVSTIPASQDAAIAAARTAGAAWWAFLDERDAASSLAQN